MDQLRLAIHKSQISLFLLETKELIASNKKHFVKRTYSLSSGEKISSIDAVLDIGLTLKQAWHEVLNLSPDNYFTGPKRDRDGSDGDVWVFKKIINGKLVYIKLKIDARGSVCMSFHEDW